jgi:hypothetical protein
VKATTPALQVWRRTRWFSAALVAFAILFWSRPVFAHNPSKSYLSLTLETNTLSGQWDVPLRDLQAVVPLDPDTNGLISWEKLQAHYAAITSYAFARLNMKVDGRAAKLRVTEADPAVEEFADGPYLEIPFVVETGSSNAADKTPATIEINYQLFFDVNSLHRGLLRLEADGKTQSAVFAPDHADQTFELTRANRLAQFLMFVREGIWHIWTGYDHILFLIALLLSAVLRRENGRWVGVTAFKPAILNVLKIVTAFTLAHSLTLSLAALGLVKIPSRITESAIAASVVLAALNNLKPMITRREWMIAFAFGLIHGFGFATALGDLGLVHGALAVTLVGFNLGVEIGQLAIVAIFLPIAFALRRTWFYQVPLLRVGSGIIILVAGTWFAERVFDFKVLPF